MLRSRLFHAVVIAGAALGANSACGDTDADTIASSTARHDSGAEANPADHDEPSMPGSNDAGSDALLSDSSDEHEDASVHNPSAHDGGGHTATHDGGEEDGGWPPTK